MKRLLVCGLLAVTAIAFSGIAMAGSQDNAKIALHIQGHTTGKGSGCAAAPANTACDSANNTSNLVVSAGVGAFDVYLLVLDGNPGAGVGGATMGIQYPEAPYDTGGGPPYSGADIYMTSWTVCANQEFSGNNWPHDGGGNVIAFDTINNCQNTPDGSDPQGDVTAVLGFFYIYTYGEAAHQMCVTTRNYIANPDFKVADCGAAESSPPYPLFAGKVGVNGAPGYSPCVEPPTPVEATTWGKLKTNFDGE